MSEQKSIIASWGDELIVPEVSTEDKKRAVKMLSAPEEVEGDDLKLMCHYMYRVSLLHGITIHKLIKQVDSLERKVKSFEDGKE